MGFTSRLAPIALTFSMMAGAAQAQDLEPAQDLAANDAANDTEYSFQCDREITSIDSTMDLPTLTAEVMPAVVYISNKLALMPPFGQMPHSDIDLPQPGKNAPPQKGSSLGSGFIVDPRGIVVTNAHVLGGNIDSTKGRAYSVILYGEGRNNEGKEYQAELIGIDDQDKVDVAVLQIKGLAEGQTLPCLRFGDSDGLEHGAFVAAYGNPLGLKFSVSAGVAANTQRETGNWFTPFIQTDADINRGNSGGPLVNRDGEVVGINTMIMSPDGFNAGLGFAIPSNIAKLVADHLNTYGEKKRGWIGVGISDLNAKMVKDAGLSDSKGVYIKNAAVGGPADLAGLKEGDVVLDVNGKTMRDALDLSRAIANVWPGETATLTLQRDGQRITLDVEVGDKDSKMANDADGNDAEGPDHEGGVIKPPEEFMPKDNQDGGDAPKDDAQPDDGTKPAPPQGNGGNGGSGGTTAPDGPNGAAPQTPAPSPKGRGAPPPNPFRFGPN